MRLKIENSYIGYLETEWFPNDYVSAVNTLHKMIKNDFNYLLIEYPKSKWCVGYIDIKTEKWIEIYSISTAKIKKLIKMGLF